MVMRPVMRFGAVQRQQIKISSPSGKTKKIVTVNNPSQGGNGKNSTCYCSCSVTGCGALLALGTLAGLAGGVGYYLSTQEQEQPTSSANTATMEKPVDTPDATLSESFKNQQAELDALSQKLQPGS